jgi:sugar lactone lactonase YvrE
MVCIAACGGSSLTSTSGGTVYSLPVAGGASQGPELFLANSVKTFAGSGAGFSDSTSSSGVSANFNRPIAIAADATNLYVADYLNNAIRKIEISSGFVTTIAGSIAGSAGSADGIGVAASFNLPTGITIVGTNLYVTDSGNYTIRKIDLVTREVTTIAGGVGLPDSVDATGLDARFNVLNGIATDGDNLYVTDSNNTIRWVEIASKKVFTLAGSPGVAGSSDGAPTAASFNQPARITVAGSNLYVTDFTNSTIRKIALATGGVTTLAGSVGPGGFAGSHADSTDGTGLTARFNQPNGITTDGVNLYVTDSYDNTIRKVVISSGATTTIAGNSAAPDGLVDGIGAAARFNTPIGITIGGSSLFVTDNQNHTIRRIE